jgi:hypothetical protein
MFIMIGAAFREIETDHNPLLKEARKRAAESYERGPANAFEQRFKSRRAENNKDSGEKSFWDEGATH